MSKTIEYRPRTTAVSRSWRLIIFLAVLHLAWLIAIDAFVWHYLDAKEFQGRLNPFGMSLLPYLPGVSAIEASNSRHGVNTLYLFTLGIALVLLAALCAGVLTTNLLARRPLAEAGRWGRFRWRLCALLVLWFGWLTVPIKLSLYYQWQHWRVGRRLAPPSRGRVYSPPHKAQYGILCGHDVLIRTRGVGSERKRA
jgi:hypothetical protein